MADGRRVRRDHNREAVLDALVELFTEGVYSPTAADIAQRAGISARSLFRYFDDVDDLVRAAVQRQLAAIGPYRFVDVPDGATTRERIDALVAARMRMHEAVGATARAGRLVAHRHPVVAEELRRVRAHLRKQIATLFAPELRTQAKAELLPALDALCSFETYDFLRASHGMSRNKVADTLRSALTALLVGAAA